MKLIKNSAALLATTLATTPILVANKDELVANKTKHGVYKDKAARRRYMRDLMRRKREASKAEEENR